MVMVRLLVKSAERIWCPLGVSGVFWLVAFGMGFYYAKCEGRSSSVGSVETGTTLGIAFTHSWEEIRTSPRVYGPGAAGTRGTDPSAFCGMGGCPPSRDLFPLGWAPTRSGIEQLWVLTLLVIPVFREWMMDIMLSNVWSGWSLVRDEVF